MDYEDRYLRLRADNMALKQERNEMEEKLKQVSAKSKRLESQLGGRGAGGQTRYKGSAATALSSSLVHKDGTDELLGAQKERIQDLQKQNKALKAQSRMRAVGAHSYAGANAHTARRPKRKMNKRSSTTHIRPGSARRASATSSAAARPGTRLSGAKHPATTTTARQPKAKSAANTPVARRIAYQAEQGFMSRIANVGLFEQQEQRSTANVNAEAATAANNYVEQTRQATAPAPLASPMSMLNATSSSVQQKPGQGAEFPLPSQHMPGGGLYSQNYTAARNETRAAVEPDTASADISLEITQLRKELRAKTAKIQLLQAHFEQLGATMRAEKDIRDHAVEQQEHYKSLLQEAQRKQRDMERKLKAVDFNSDQVENLQIVIADLRAQNRTLQDRVKLLTTNIFEADTIEKSRLQSVVAEYTNQLKRQARNSEDRGGRVAALEKELTSKTLELQEQSRIAHDAKQKATGMERQLSSALKQVSKLTDRMAVFSADSGVELDDLERALDIIRRERERPSQVSFIGATSGAVKAPTTASARNSGDGAGAGAPIEPASLAGRDALVQLKRRVQELEIQNRDLLVELKQKTDMLKVQNEINKQQKNNFNDDKNQIVSLKLENERLKYDLRTRPSGWDPLSESIFAMSEADSELPELTGTDNMVALRVISAKLDPNFALFAEGPPLTFLSADFFEFETSISEVFGGFEPEYFFTSQYLLNTDAFFVRFLESEVVTIELHRQIGGTRSERIGICELELRPLLTPSAMVEGTAKIRSTHIGVGKADDENDGTAKDGRGVVMGSIRFVLRMRRPVLSHPPSPRSAKALSVASSSGMHHGVSAVAAVAGAVKEERDRQANMKKQAEEAADRATRAEAAEQRKRDRDLWERQQRDAERRAFEHERDERERELKRLELRGREREEEIHRRELNLREAQTQAMQKERELLEMERRMRNQERVAAASEAAEAAKFGALVKSGPAEPQTRAEEEFDDGDDDDVPYHLVAKTEGDSRPGTADSRIESTHTLGASPQQQKKMRRREIVKKPPMSGVVVNVAKEDELEDSVSASVSVTSESYGLGRRPSKRPSGRRSSWDDDSDAGAL